MNNDNQMKKLIQNSRKRCGQNFKMADSEQVAKEVIRLLKDSEFDQWLDLLAAGLRAKVTKDYFCFLHHNGTLIFVVREPLGNILRRKIVLRR
eukprot:UN02758